MVSSIPPASLVSQSMALVSWLNEVEESEKNEEENTPSDNQIVASLQESLLLDPTNPLAAASLGIETS